MCLHLGVISVAILEAAHTKQLRLILPALRFALLAPQRRVLGTNTAPGGHLPELLLLLLLRPLFPGRIRAAKT